MIPMSFVQINYNCHYCPLFSYINFIILQSRGGGAKTNTKPVP